MRTCEHSPHLCAPCAPSLGFLEGDSRACSPGDLSDFVGHLFGVLSLPLPNT